MAEIEGLALVLQQVTILPTSTTTEVGVRAVPSDRKEEWAKAVAQATAQRDTARQWGEG